MENINLDEAYEIAMNIINHSFQFTNQLRMKLIKKKLDSSIIEKIIIKLTESGMLNDQYFGKIYAEELIRIKKNSFLLVIKKLQGRGLNSNEAELIAKLAIEEYGGEEVILKEYIKKNKTSLKRILDTKGKEKVYTKIKTQGFYRVNYNEIPDLINNN